MVDEPRPLAPQECSHKLCHEQATEAVEVFNPWTRCLFMEGQVERRTGYALCEAHFRRYFPRGPGYVGREESVALRIQCREATYA